jgi:hypothetical protein
MPYKIAITVTMLAAGIMLTACSLFQEKIEKKPDSEPIVSSEVERLLPGTWKIMAVKCDSTGSNCEQYAPSRVFEFSANGELTVNGMKRGIFRLENRNCILDTGSKQYTVTIVQIGAYRMVTGEPYRNTTEVLNRIK